MIRFIARRCFQSVFVIFGVIVITFLISRVIGDPVSLLLPPEASEEERVYLTKEFGLDRPLYIQLVHYMGSVIQGNFGTSFRHEQPALRLLFERVPASLQLATFAIVISLIVAIPLGILAAINRGTVFDRIAMTFALFGQSVPSFWLGIMLILLLSVKLKMLPPSGKGGMQYFVMPGLTLAFFCTAAIARLTRSCFLDILDMDFVKTARLKGVPEIFVILKHVLKNALITILNITGLQFGIIFGSSVVVEFIFAWPGIGRLSLEAVFNRDYPVVQAVVVMISFFFVVVNLLIDVVYALVDPRVSRK